MDRGSSFISGNISPQSNISDHWDDFELNDPNEKINREISLLGKDKLLIRHIALFATNATLKEDNNILQANKDNLATKLFNVENQLRSIYQKMKP